MPVAFHLGNPTGNVHQGPIRPTYRHLHSASLHAANPLRVIALIDVDSCYAQMEAKRLGVDPSVPFAVQQWQGLIAINYAAKAHGLTRHATVDEARKKCPEIVIAHVATIAQGETEPGYHKDATYMTHKVSLEYYRRESRKILEIFCELATVVEKASIDEAFFDLSEEVRAILCERYPVLRKVPESGLDTQLPPPPFYLPHPDLGYLVPLSETCGPIRMEDTVKDEKGKSKEEIHEYQTTWPDIALCIGAEIILKCRSAVKDRLGYTCSAGLAKNKTLAKLAAGSRKPDGQTILRDAAINDFIALLPFQKIRFLGGKLGRAIATDFEATTVKDLWTHPAKRLQEKLGEQQGMWVYEVIRGIDHSRGKHLLAASKDITELLSVEEGKIHVKSLIASKFFFPALEKFDDAVYWLRMQSSELQVRLSEAQERCPHVWPKTLALGYRASFTHYTHQTKQTAFPFVEKLTTEYILNLATRLLKEFLSGRKGAGVDPDLGFCTGLNLRFQDLERVEPDQQAIDAFLSPTKGVKRKRTESNNVMHNQLTPKIVKKEDQDLSIKFEGIHEVDFVCAVCCQVISEQVIHDGSCTIEDAEKAALAKLIQEHNDLHFAQDLLSKQRVIVGGIADLQEKKPKLRDNTRKTSRKATRTLSAYFS